MIKPTIVSHADKALLAERINKLATALADGVYERQETIKLCLLTALAGESVFLLGPPGIGKSLIAKRLIQAFDSSSYFEYLMTRFSTPEEVFGPLSIQELKDNGRYLRLTEGYLPTSQVVFLDEIWKAGPAILNTLLTVVNEKTFKNGSDIERVPMRLLISASNELPEEDSGLEALYDRMLVRIFVNRIQNKQNFKSMLTVGTPLEAQIPQGLAITDTEYHQWQQELEAVSLPDDVFDKLYQLKTMLESAAEHHHLADSDLYVSDRRWKKAVKLLKASAFFNGRDAVNPLDLLLLQDCLWNSPESLEIIAQALKEFALNHAFDQQNVSMAIERIKEDMRDIQYEIEAELAISLAMEAGSGLRRKDTYQYNLSHAKTYQVGNAGNLVKLVLLQSNMSVSENEKGDSRWVYIAKDELSRAIKDGGSEVYGYVNHNTHLCRLRVEVDANQQLAVKDVANRSVLATLVSEGVVSVEKLQTWAQASTTLVSQLQETEHHLRLVRSKFHAALPHGFIRADLPTEMEINLSQVASYLDNTIVEAQKSAARIKEFTDSFA